MSISFVLYHIYPTLTDVWDMFLIPFLLPRDQLSRTWGKIVRDELTGTVIRVERSCKIPHHYEILADISSTHTVVILYGLCSIQTYRIHRTTHVLSHVSKPTLLPSVFMSFRSEHYCCTCGRFMSLGVRTIYLIERHINRTFTVCLECKHQYLWFREGVLIREGGYQPIYYSTVQRTVILPRSHLENTRGLRMLGEIEVNGRSMDPDSDTVGLFELFEHSF
jgi:hypothetical protein